MTPPLEPPVGDALDAWGRLYGGELETYPAPGALGVEAAAVRLPELRAARGNWPKVFHHRRRSERAVVLIHGLKDSPGYLEAVALRFAADGANVLLPLLPGHGRRDPARAMRRVGREAWRATVDAAAAIAAGLGREVSIGGLSAGGALAVDKCLRDAGAIAGKVFLFSAALGLFPAHRLLLSTARIPRWIDAWMARRANTGLGGNPYKYSRRFFAGGRQVHLLIDEIRRRAGAAPRPYADFEHRDRSFVAHSEADRTIPLAAVEPLVRRDDPGQHHILPRARGVAHAELVLAETMTYRTRWPGEPEAPRANPEFGPMMAKALAFLER